MARRINEFVVTHWGGQRDGRNLISKNAIRSFVGDDDDPAYVPPSDMESVKLQAIVAFLLRHAPALVSADQIYDDAPANRALAAMCEFYAPDDRDAETASNAVEAGRYIFESSTDTTTIASEFVLEHESDTLLPGYVVRGHYTLWRQDDLVGAMEPYPYTVKGFALVSQGTLALYMRQLLYQKPVTLMADIGAGGTSPAALLVPETATEYVALPRLVADGILRRVEGVASGAVETRE